MSTPEDKVKQEVIKTLSAFETTGDILWWSRLQSGKVQDRNSCGWIQLCQKGTPDFISIFQTFDRRLIVLFIECKRDDVRSSLNDNQKMFFEKYDKRHKDLKFLVTQSGFEVSKFISSLMYDRIQEIDL